MLKEHKNDIYRTIQDVGLNPTTFILKDSIIDNFHISTLTLIGTDMAFIFKIHEESWWGFKFRYTQFKPNYPLSEWKPSGPKSYYEYYYALKHFVRWLKTDLNKYIEDNQTVNKWNDFQFETNIFDLTQIKFTNNAKFTSVESQSISESLVKLKKLMLENFAFTNNQLQFMNERLEYLDKATNRLMKFDWVNTMVSIMVSIAINMTFDTDTGKKFFELIGQAFHSLAALLNA